ncbi:trp region conserved hypothetical membrane protein [Streptomyces sp. OV198]|nr:trp region conserved hypothetical membrane protein [Streptomyces sp. OV198]
MAVLSTRQSWSEGTATVAGGAFPLTAKGSDVTGVPAALAIVGLAALVAVFAVRSSGRFLVSALLALSGAGTVVPAVLGAGDSSALGERAVSSGSRQYRRLNRGGPSTVPAPCLHSCSMPVPLLPGSSRRCSPSWSSCSCLNRASRTHLPAPSSSCGRAPSRPRTSPSGPAGALRATVSWGSTTMSASARRVQAHTLAVAAEHALIHAVPRQTAAAMHTAHSGDPRAALADHAG